MSEMTIQCRTIESPEGGNDVIYVKFKKHRLPRKYKKAQVKLGNRKYLKLISGSNFISYDGRSGFDNFCKSFKSQYVGGIDSYDNDFSSRSLGITEL